MIDSSQRIVLTTGAAAAAATTAPQVFAQAPQAEAPQGLPAGAKIGFYEKSNVRIRYAEIGSGFPLLATPGGDLFRVLAEGNAIQRHTRRTQRWRRCTTRDSSPKRYLIA